MVFQAEKQRGARIVILAYKNAGSPSMDLSLTRIFAAMLFWFDITLLALARHFHCLSQPGLN